jgi:hypothetical protein
MDVEYCPSECKVKLQPAVTAVAVAAMDETPMFPVIPPVGYSYIVHKQAAAGPGSPT